MSGDDKRAYVLLGVFIFALLVAAVSGPIKREYLRQFPDTTFNVSITQGGVSCEYKVTPNGYGSEIAEPVDPECPKDRPAPKRRR